MLKEENPIWKDILNARYGYIQRYVYRSEGTSKHKRASTWWKDIQLAGLNIEENNGCFVGNMEYKTGSRGNIFFSLTW